MDATPVCSTAWRCATVSRVHRKCGRSDLSAVNKRHFRNFQLLVQRDSRAGITSESGGIPVLYKKIYLELIAVADEADAVVVELNAALDRLEEKHTLFGGGIETVAFEYSGTRKRSALAHAIAAGETVADGMRAARKSVNVALRAVI
jgi:hypothetical protein